MTAPSPGARECATDIVGHKTFDTGEIGPEGFPVLRHEPLTRAEADALWETCGLEKAKRAESMPDEASALRTLMDAYTRLQELGWRPAMYGPTDGRALEVIECGSTGIHKAHRDEKRRYWVYDGDIWPSDPVLFREPAPEAPHD